MRRTASRAASWGLAALLALAGNARAQDAAEAAAAPPDVAAIRACAVGDDQDDSMRCHAWIVADEAGNAKTFDGPAGYHPADLREAYHIFKNGTKQTTIAIVDAYHYPTAEADLNVYRKEFGIPPCTKANGCFRQVNQHGGTRKYPIVNVGWNQEEALDIQMASAICPKCRILIVEADNNHSPNLGKAVDTAVRLGAHVVSNSYGGKEHWSPPQEYHYNHPGVAITASSGDSGLGPAFPATSPHVTAVGGTFLHRDATVQRGWTETAWNGAGSGCSQFYPKPKWQHDKGCPNRMEADVSAVAAPSTGVAVYAPNGRGSSSWLVFGGTSVAAPIIAGMYGLNDGTVTYGKDPYEHTDLLNDVTSGSNGSCNGKYRCTARVGYDGPTGWGTPNGFHAFGE
jgi:subtilase family serine protease